LCLDNSAIDYDSHVLVAVNIVGCESVVEMHQRPAVWFHSAVGMIHEALLEFSNRFDRFCVNGGGQRDRYRQRWLDFLQKRLNSAKVARPVWTRRCPDRGSNGKLRHARPSVYSLETIRGAMLTCVKYLTVEHHSDFAFTIKASDPCKAAGFVLGLPLNMDGSEGSRAQSTRGLCPQPRKLDGGE
jgi:hypothetical protein